VVFVFLPLKGKQEKSQLSVLCVSAVNIIQAKTLSGSPFKPPLLGVVVDCHCERSNLNVFKMNEFYILPGDCRACAL
jgi:hypothetical protein